MVQCSTLQLLLLPQHCYRYSQSNRTSTLFMWLSCGSCKCTVLQSGRVMCVTPSTHGARVNLVHMFCFLSLARRRLRKNRTKLVADMMFVRMATPLIAKHTAAARSINCGKRET
jgi:hypothetical protein